MATASHGMLLALASFTATLVPLCEGYVVLFVNVLDVQLEDNTQLYAVTNPVTAGILYFAAKKLNATYFSRCGGSREWKAFIADTGKALTHAEIYCQELVIQESLCYSIGFVNLIYVLVFWAMSFLVFRTVDNEAYAPPSNYVLANFLSAGTALVVARLPSGLSHRMTPLS